jgi:molybdopterin-guanine dinucleotide biosynthesis protein A
MRSDGADPGGGRLDDGSDLTAIVLAGGRARRLGGGTKPARAVGGTPLLVRVLEAVRGAAARVVVGPAELAGLLPAGVLRTSEEPPGAGPVAAIAAGLAMLPVRPALVALLGGDLPFVNGATLWTLRDALETRDIDAAVVIDERGRPQWMLAVWRAEVLRRRLDALRVDVPRGDVPRVDPRRGGDDLAGRGGLAGRGMRELAAGVRLGEVPMTGAVPPPWFDCDTEDDLRQAEEWARGDAG